MSGAKKTTTHDEAEKAAAEASQVAQDVAGAPDGTNDAAPTPEAAPVDSEAAPVEETVEPTREFVGIGVSRLGRDGWTFEVDPETGYTTGVIIAAPETED